MMTTIITIIISSSSSGSDTPREIPIIKPTFSFSFLSAYREAYLLT